MSDHFEKLASHYLATTVRDLRELKALAEKAITQVRDDQALYRRLDSESNSIAVLVHHLVGNMLSRWTDFLDADGEKPSRRRDEEFEDFAKSRVALLGDWERGWSCVFDALDPLSAKDLQRTVMIGGKPHTVIEAINRQVVHYSAHVGQIILLAKHCESERWESLSIPRKRPSPR